VRVKDTGFIRALREQRLSPADSAVSLAYHCLLQHFEAMLAEEPRAWEGEDPEGAHQMRVATRRLRAAFRIFRGVLPARAAGSLNREFRWLAAMLGEVRDLDVYQENLKRYALEIPAEDSVHLTDYQEHLRRQWRRARERLLACLESRRYQRLKVRLARFLEHGPSRRILKEFRTLTIADAARQLIGKRYKRVLRDGRALAPDSPDESFHALRIQCKRLRYLFEFFDSSYGGLLQPHIKRLKRLQDVLGEIQDARVATEQLSQYASRVLMRSRNRGQLIALGQLISGQRRQAAFERGDFLEAWKRFDRKRRRKAILASLGETSTSDEWEVRTPENNEDQSIAPAELDPSSTTRSA
jgi:CHAD domain-containing protein